MKVVGLDAETLSQLQLGDESALRKLFDDHFQELFKYSSKITNDRDVAEEIVQDVFINLWEKKCELSITSSLAGYLKTAVKNRSINHLKKRYLLLETGADELTMVAHSDDSDQHLFANELEVLMKKALDQLPEKTQLVFSLSRNLDFSHQEIAEELSISKKGVEYHISLVLKHLRDFLSKYGYCFLTLLLA